MIKLLVTLMIGLTTVSASAWEVMGKEDNSDRYRRANEELNNPYSRSDNSHRQSYRQLEANPSVNSNRASESVYGSPKSTARQLVGV